MNLKTGTNRPSPPPRYCSTTATTSRYSWCCLWSTTPAGAAVATTRRPRPAARRRRRTRRRPAARSKGVHVEYPNAPTGALNARRARRYAACLGARACDVPYGASTPSAAWTMSAGRCCCPVAALAASDFGQNILLLLQSVTRCCTRRHWRHPVPLAGQAGPA